MASGDIKAYALDSVGVVVDTGVIGDDPNALTKAQNAIPDPLGKGGGIRKRPGLKPFNTAAGNGVVLGGVGVPAFLGSAGPDFENPFPVLPVVTVTRYTTPVSTGRKGGTFDDEGDAFDFDPFGDFDEEAPAAPNAEETETPTGDTGSSMWTLFIVGDGTDWYVALNTTLTLHLDNSTTYPTPASMLFPIASLRTETPIAGWHTGGSTSALRGRVMASVDQMLFYIQDGN